MEEKQMQPLPPTEGAPEQLEDATEVPQAVTTPPDATTAAALPTLGMWHTKRIMVTGGLFVCLILIALLTTLFSDNPLRREAGIMKQFTNVYAFVPEKLSASALIPITLPAGIDEQTARDSISFNPEVEGEWVTEEQEGVIIFRPEEALTRDAYYEVSLDLPGAQMSGDFYVDEDPEVSALFPASGSETNEASEITIVFNRPMVPLTTLEVNEEKPLPISITPETKGRFKWISTRTLQFKPETTLRPSSEYVVTVGDGLTSVDGVAVSPFTHTFQTRPLRYENVLSGVVGYRSPVVITFNQPVDLNKTAPQVRVVDSNGNDVPIYVSYGETQVYDWETGKTRTEENPSMLYVYSKQDRHGRDGFWDFDSPYTLTIQGGETPEGTIPLTEQRTANFVTPNIVEDVTALSDRTGLARADFFDPEGTLAVRFYDEIDIEKLDYDVRGKKSVVYGERCKTDEDGQEIWKGSSCEMESDPHTLIFSFESGKLGIDTPFTLELKRVFAKDGSRINPDTYTIDFRTYPPFVIKKTDPENGNTNAAVDGMTICSTVPLRDLGEDEGMKKYVNTAGYIVFGRWSGSSYIEPSSTWYRGPCARGDFETKIPYGLLPQTAYTLALTLTDAFGQTAVTERSITTKPPEEQYTRLHNLQQAYNVTRPGRTKLTYAAENLESVNLHICKMSPEQFLSRTIDGYESTETPTDGECSELTRDVITLPPLYWVNNYFQIDLAKYFGDTRGHYVVTLGSPLYVTEEYNYETRTSTKRPLYDRTLVSVTNLAVGKKEVERYENSQWSRSQNPKTNALLAQGLQNASNLYWVTDSQTLAGIPGASVTQYTGRYDTTPLMRSVGVTDVTGIARVKVDSQVIGAVIRSGVDSAIITDWADQLGYAGGSESASRTYVYTDRPIYRPGQTVYARGIDRIGFDGSYESTMGESVPFTVYDARDAKIYDTKLTMSRYGTFNTSFELPADAPLGIYRLEAFGQSSYVSVEEYVPAAFKIDSRTEKDEFISGDTIELGIQADYYFGVPLDQGTVSYSVTAQDYYFDRYTDEYFNFGSSWYYCYYCDYGDQYLFRGEERLNEKGHATIRRSFDLNEYFTNDETKGSKLITISYTVKDRNGRAVSGQRSFVVHQSDFYLGLQTSEYYTEKNKPITLRVKSVDTTGKPIAKSGITRSVFKIEWETFKRQEVDGGFYYRSEEKRTLISEESIKTDKDGNWSGTLTLAENGEYEIEVRAEDEKGNQVKTTSHLYIYGGGAVYVPPNNNYELDLEMTDSNLKVGDMASVLIKSPYERAKVLVTAERGTVYDYWILEVNGGLYNHRFPIKESYAPNVVISALLLSPDPEVKYGSVWLPIESDKNKLTVEVTSDKERYLPGEAVTLRVRTLDATNKPVSAEVSLAVADLSVLALRGNPKKDPYTFFYDGFPLSVSTASNIKNILYEAEIPLGTKGGDGGNPDDLAKKQRGVFKDTAYWNATVVTDANGDGLVTFTLPDNLTTWQIESLAVTEDTKLGVGYKEFTTKKDLMAVPLKPRFIIAGDTFSLGAHVFNQSKETETIRVKLESDTLTFNDESETEVRVGPGESTSVFFEVVAPKTMREGIHTFVFTAESSRGIDSVKQEIPITKNTVYETTATAYFTKENSASEYLYIPKEVVRDDGGLTINANATLAVFMSDALTYMAEYPYGCSEQIASSLSTIAMVKRALDVPGVEGTLTTVKDMYGNEQTVDAVVESGLARIYESQTAGGGIAYYKGLQPNVHLSIRIALALSELKKAGFTVKEGVIENLLRYIESGTETEFRMNPNGMMNLVILAEYTLRTVGGKTETTLTPRVLSVIEAKKLNEELSSESLGFLAILTAEGFGARDKKLVYDALLNRLDIDGRGAYLKSGGSLRGYYETNIANTALLLRAFVAHEDEHVELGNVLRWILKSRDRDGVWGGTQNTFAVVTALIDYLEWQKETEAQFTLKGILDGTELFSHQFSPENVFETFTKYVPMAELTAGKLLPLRFERMSETTPSTNFYYDMALRYYLPAESVPPRDEGITITRGLYRLDDTSHESPLTSAVVGDVVQGKITLTIPERYTDVAIEDFIPAGFELINSNLDTEDATLDDTEGEYNEFYGMSNDTIEKPSLLARAVDRVRSFFQSDTNVAQVQYWSNGTYGRPEARTMKLYPTHKELHDDRVFIFVDALSPGVYEYKYYLRALVPGEFQHMPAKAEELYFPEIFGRTDGGIFTVKEGG